MDKIEILSVDLLNQHRAVVEELKKLARSLGMEFGWHYLLDLSWMISMLEDVNGKQIMDGGAGTGVMQWYLAEHGATVISVDRGSRADLPLRLRNRFNINGLRPSDLRPAPVTALRLLAQASSLKVAGSVVKQLLEGGLQALFSPTHKQDSGGKVILYNQDLAQLVGIPSNSLDAVVAVSALEHNPPENLRLVIEELMRVIKPGGFLLATLGAALHQDWFHEPSKGWCYTDASLRSAFGLADSTPSNYDRYEALFSDLRNCDELKENLAAFYSRSGDNGMPWGKWDPQYQSVGVCKVK